MIDLSHLAKLPEGEKNPTIVNETRKIEIVCLDKPGRIEIPVRIVRPEISVVQYMFLVLSLNYIINE